MSDNDPSFKELDAIHVEIEALFDGSADDLALGRITSRSA
ncbi:hypothetical protein LMG27174_00429 [Paraburkholderia rhynchosiae]|uniref:Uncharacterized protein n=1 Tax=Paraburkholderia rhynchosiae TaxID=487049 RepID=A0A6J4ZSQ3_9BURK|nr:hypothetical protein LMG27174_00429 [Paraburkholderia rhynchosiae]